MATPAAATPLVVPHETRRMPDTVCVTPRPMRADLLAAHVRVRGGLFVRIREVGE